MTTFNNNNSNKIVDILYVQYIKALVLIGLVKEGTFLVLSQYKNTKIIDATLVKDNLDKLHIEPSTINSTNTITTTIIIVSYYKKCDSRVLHFIISFLDL